MNIGDIVEDDLSVGEYIWNWPIKNYGNIQINDYKFKLDKSFHNNYPAWRAEGIWETVDIKEAKGGPFRSYLFYDPNENKTYQLFSGMYGLFDEDKRDLLVDSLENS